MTDDKNTIDDMWLNALTGRDDSDVSGQFLDKEQIKIIKEAELVREALLSIDKKEQSQAEEFDVDMSKEKLIEKLKNKNLL